MSQHNSAAEIARRIVASADHISYLAEALGKSPLPRAWTGGPALEVRVRFRPRLASIDDADLARRLRAMRIDGPLTSTGIARLADGRPISDEHLAPNLPWRPRALGLWRMNPKYSMGVKVFASSRPPVDLLIAVPARFRIEGELVHPSRFPEQPDQLARFATLCDAMLRVLRDAQPIALIDAVHVQDQIWCDSLHQADLGLVVPSVVCAANGWAPIAGSEREGWVGISLDA